jgi:uncharacterized protein DUF3987
MPITTRSPKSPLTPEAQSAFAEYVNQNKTERLAMGDSPLAGAWAKFEALPARIALVLQMVTDAISGSPQFPNEFIFLPAMQSALAITQWFKNESRRVYALLGKNVDRPEETLLDWIGKIGGRVTPRDLQRHSRKYPTSESAEAALAQLVAAGLGRWEVVKPDGPGKPSTIFILGSTPR